MKRVIVLATACILTLGLSGCGAKEEVEKLVTNTKELVTSPKEEVLEPVVLKVAHNQTSLENPYQFGLNKFAEELERISEGKMEVEIFPGTLGTNESDLIVKLTTNSVDMVVASPGYMSGTGIKELDLLSLLYLFDDFDDWEAKIDGAFGNRMKDIITEKTENDYKIVGYYSSGVRNYYGKQPITEPSDINGLSIRLQTSPTQKQFWEDLGAEATSIGWQELHEALANGSVDAAENDITNMMLKEHHKTINGKYTSLTAHDYTTRLVLMNGKNFDSYTKEQQGWILEAVKVSETEERMVTYRMIEDSKDKVEADGGIINEVNLKAFKELAITIQDDYAEKNGLVELLELTR